MLSAPLKFRYVYLHKYLFYCIAGVNYANSVYYYFVEIDYSFAIFKYNILCYFINNIPYTEKTFVYIDRFYMLKINPFILSKIFSNILIF